MLTQHRAPGRALYSHINAPADPELAAHGVTELTIAERVPHAWAERIVRAVNAHDELVAALRTIRDELHRLGADATGPCELIARAALARLDATTPPQAAQAPAAPRTETAATEAPTVQKTELRVVVLHPVGDRPHKYDLATIADEIDGGDWLGSWSVHSAEDVPRDRVAAECVALGNDGTFFDDPFPEDADEPERPA